MPSYQIRRRLSIGILAIALVAPAIACNDTGSSNDTRNHAPPVVTGVPWCANCVEVDCSTLGPPASLANQCYTEAK